MEWRKNHRPGYFGRRRDEKVAALNVQFGVGNWELRWIVNIEHLGAANGERLFTFEEACKEFYEQSYYRYFKDRPADIEYACQFKECYDNEPNNIDSGLDYTIQKSYSTHIQDIALRNVLKRLGKQFLGTNGGYMQVRSKDSAGARFSPYNVPFLWPDKITQPSLAPEWSPKGTVEDFWQSNKWVVIKT